MKPIAAVILAGGKAKRMWPFTQDKCLISFLGKPIIEIIIDELQIGGVKDFIVVANSRNQQTITNLIKVKKLKLRIVLQEKPLGMANAILTTENFIPQTPILIINADDYFLPNILKGLISQINQQEVVLTGMEVNEYLEAGYFKIINKQIAGIIEKPGRGKEPSNLCKLVADYYQQPKLLLKELKGVKTDKDDLYEIALDKILRSVKSKLVKIKREQFQQFKYPWHILDIMIKILENIFSSNISKKSKISGKAIIEGKVIIEDGVQVMAGAIIKGPVYIGRDSIIGNNVLVRHSMIGRNCVVGFGSEVARSWIGDDTWLHGNYIGDSVIEGYSNFGSGSRTANFRFDELPIKIHRDGQIFDTGRVKFGIISGKGVKVGINASLMPGVLLGSKSLIGPGIVLKRNTKEDEKVWKCCV